MEKPNKFKLKLTTAATTENNNKNNKQYQMSEPTISKLIDKLKTYPRILLRKPSAIITHSFI